MAWTKLKTGIVAGVGALCLVATVPVVLHKYETKHEPIGWRQRFEAVYKLNDGEVLKHVAPPFIPERAEYYHREPRLSTPAKYNPEPPSSFIFRQTGPQLQYGGATFGAVVMRLFDVCRGFFQIGRPEMEGPEELLNLPLNGDWTIRAGLDREQLRQALEEIIHRETGRTIRIEPRQVERTVLVARGRLLPALRANLAKGALPQIDIYAEKKDGMGGMGGGDTRELVAWISNLLNLRMVNEIPPESQAIRLGWRIHSDSWEWNMGARREELQARVLDNITAQTGIAFVPAKRTVEVWFVSEPK